MNKPYIDSISTKSDSKYLLIVAAAKRARQITVTEPELTRSGKVNPVSQALHEIDEDDLTWDVGDSDAPLPESEAPDEARETPGEAKEQTEPAVFAEMQTAEIADQI